MMGTLDEQIRNFFYPNPPPPQKKTFLLIFTKNKQKSKEDTFLTLKTERENSNDITV